MPAETWFILKSPPTEPPENMAWDEALLERAVENRTAVLRFYSWRQPAATFGYFQKYDDVAAWTSLRPLIRRPTGGGLVPHDADWTYSLAFPPDHWWYRSAATESYRRLHEWIGQAFSKLKQTTELAAVARKDLPGQCFAGAEQFDLIWSGRKLAGAAQRRARWGLLIQGSVQPPAGLPRENWETAMQRAAEEHWAIEWQPFAIDRMLRERVATLTAEKYSQPAFNQKR